jgi:hypothetical protein
LAFSYWTIKPWFLTEEKTCCYIHHTFLLGFPNWPVIYFINYTPTSSLAPFITAPSIVINHLCKALSAGIKELKTWA